jgi:hypothetical protein
MSTSFSHPVEFLFQAAKIEELTILAPNPAFKRELPDRRMCGTILRIYVNALFHVPHHVPELNLHARQAVAIIARVARGFFGDFDEHEGELGFVGIFCY